MAPDQILHLCAKELKCSRTYEPRRMDKKYPPPQILIQTRRTTRQDPDRVFAPHEASAQTPSPPQRAVDQNKAPSPPHDAEQTAGEKA
jgi:hypothetical protein